LKKRLLLLTGAPDSGKTTVLVKTSEKLRAAGLRVGGMISNEVRAVGNRAGFEILDLQTGRKGWLAHVDQTAGPQIGKYHVNIGGLDNIGVEAILRALEGLDVVFVDEIGLMELFSLRLREAITKVVEGQKLAVCTVHWKMRDALIGNVTNREDTEVFTVTKENRDRLAEVINDKALDFLRAFRVDGF